MSFLKNCLEGLLLLTACAAFGSTHTVGNYRIKAGADGSYALYHHEQLIGRQSSFLAQDTQWKHLFSLATAAAEFTETADHGKAVLTWRVRRTQAFEDFSQTLTLTDDGLEWRIAAKPVADIFDATASFLIPSELGIGAQYCVVKGDGSRSYLKFQEEPPRRADVNLPGTTGAGQYFIRTSAGVIHLTFTPSNASAGDFRPNQKTPYFAFTSWSRNIKNGQRLERVLKIKVLPETGFPGQDAKLEAPRISNTAISNSELRGDYIAAKLHWQPGTLERLIFLPDNAELTRNLNPGDNYGGKLKWKPWKSPEVKLRATETNTVTASRTESDFRLIENYSLKPEESALRIRAEFTNLAAARQQDTPEFSVMIIPGRREREYNPDAFAVFLGEEAAPETLRIISCWGEYRRNQVSAVALCDREMRSVFVLNFPDRARRADAVTLKIGSQDSHAGRDMGKRSSLIWTYGAIRAGTTRGSSIRRIWWLTTH